MKRNKVEALLHHLNSQHKSIVFTLEMEVDGKLPFMDVTTNRTGNDLRINIYRKPTHTGRYLNFASNHPSSAKRSVVRSLLNRTKYIRPAEDLTKTAEVQKITEDLEANGYAQSFIKRVTSTRSARKTEADLGHISAPTTASIPYVQGVSEAISRILTPFNIRTVMKPTTLKWSLMKRAKDTLPAEETPGAIYALGCAECPRVYIGETARTAKQRTREHKCHANTGHTELSAVARHVHEEAHRIHWKATVIARETDTTKRKIKEALAIRRLEKNSGEDKIMNQDRGLGISKIWLDLA